MLRGTELRVSQTRNSVPRNMLIILEITKKQNTLIYLNKNLNS